VPFAEARLSDVQHLTGVPAPLFAGAEFAAWFGAWRDLDDARIDAIVRASVSQKIAHTPTLVMWERLSRFFDPGAASDPALALLPRYYREVLWRPGDGFPFLDQLTVEGMAALKTALPVMERVVKRLHDAGVRIHAGSDTPNPSLVPGASLHEELRLLVQAGLTPEEAWIAGTRAAGESLGGGQLGVVDDGAPADFLVFGEDPTKDLRALSTLRAVVARGRLYPREMLDDAVARHRAHQEGPLYDVVSTAVSRPLIRWTLRGTLWGSAEAAE
jgi:hypothetical protein